MLRHYTFQEVTLVGKRKGPCTVCGRECTRTEKFFQTLNPFNKNADGTVKTRQDIVRELKPQVEAWEKANPTHVKCEK